MAQRKGRLSRDFAALPAPVFAWERVGDDLMLVDFNTAALEQTNHGVAALLGRTARDLYADQPQVRDAMLAALQSREPETREMQYMMVTTGITRTMNVTFIPAADDLVLAVTEDLTERRGTQQALRESELRYRLLVEGAPDGIVVHREGTILYANDAFARIVGAPPEEIIGTPVLDHVHPDDRASVRERVLMTQQGERVPLAEERLLRADGSVVYTEIAGIPTTYDGLPATQAIVRDVSDRHRAQALFVALSEQALAGVSVVQDGVLRYVNPRCAELFGYTQDEMIGMRSDDLVAESSREFVQQMQRPRLHEGRGTVHFTFTALRKDRSEAEIEVYGSVVDLDGRPALVGTLLDATERERMSLQLRQAQKMDAVGQLAGGIAHDFNNILTAIVSYAELVLGELPKDAPVREDVREIVEAAQRASQLTRQLLAFSRQQALEPRAVDVGVVLHDMGSMLRRLLGAGIELSIAREPNVPTVLADRVQLEQVVLNLAVNARDAMVGTGRLRLETKPARYQLDEVSAHPGLKPGAYARIDVSDSGPGIPPEVMPRIFEPFFTTKPAGQGTGLGLAVVYGIVKQSGGYIMVDTAPGSGTTFSVLLPAAMA
jgi:PAS domain S-box-containing protein